MTKLPLHKNAICLTLFSLLALNVGGAFAALDYTCDQLGTMAARFYDLKDKGQDLEAVLAVIQKASKNNPEKEELLSNTAIEIFIDPSIRSSGQARNQALENCQS